MASVTLSRFPYEDAVSPEQIEARRRMVEYAARWGMPGILPTTNDHLDQ